MKRKLCACARIVSVVLLGLFAVSTYAGEIWRNDWIIQATPALHMVGGPGGVTKPHRAFGFSGNGDAFFFGPADGRFSIGYDPLYHLARIGSDGSLRWHASINQISVQQAYAIVAGQDDTAFLMLGDSDYGADLDDRIDHVDASGAILWSRYLPTGWLVEMGNGRVASLGCYALSVIDEASGQVIWQRRFAIDRPCVGDLAADVQGNLYLALGEGNGSAPSGFRATKFAADGSELWSAAALDGRSLIGVGNGKVFVQTATDVRALNANDGSLAWTVATDGNAVLMVNSDPILIESNGVRRLAGSDGSSLWSTPITGLTGVAATIGNGLVLSRSNGFTRLDAASGAQDWTHASSDASWYGFGGFDGTYFVAATDSGFHRVDAATGAVAAITLPAIERSLAAANVTDGSGDVVSAGFAAEQDQLTLRVRSVESNTGATLWETSDTPAAYAYGWMLELPHLTLAPDTVVIAPDESYAFCPAPPFSGPSAITSFVSSYDRSNGQRRWLHWLREGDEQCAKNSQPLIDSNGDVFVAKSAAVYSCDGMGNPCTRRSLLKLAAATGDIIWRVDETFWLDADPQVISLIGNDVLLHGPFPPSQDTLRKVSGATGAVLWASDAFHDNPASISDTTYLVDPSRVVVFSPTPASTQWSAIDTNTGATLWTGTTPPRPACTSNSCAGGSELLQANGDLLISGERAYSASLGRYRNDGSGQFDESVLAVGSPSLSATLTFIWNDADTSLRSYFHRGMGGSLGSLGFLSTIDTAAGLLTGKQAIGAYNPDALQWVYPAFLRSPAHNRLLVERRGSASTGSALIDTTATVHGNLAVVLSIDSPQVQPGDLLGFHLTVTYTGDAPITGVHAFALMPWFGGAVATCSGTNCVVDTRSGHVDATFDMAPGDSVLISGHVRVLDRAFYRSAISARAWGPIELDEANEIDNFAQGTIAQSLFFDGFD